MFMNFFSKKKCFQKNMPLPWWKHKAIHVIKIIQTQKQTWTHIHPRMCATREI